MSEPGPKSPPTPGRDWIEPIPDTFENIVRAIVTTPPRSRPAPADSRAENAPAAALAASD